MERFPKGGIIGRLLGLMRRLGDLDIPVYAANACYFIILSLFPTLVLLLSLLRYTQLDIHALLALLQGVVPSAILPEVEILIVNTYESTSGMVLSVSAITALWSASRGVYGLLTGLNTIYGVSEDRGYLYTRTISVVYTLLFLLVLLLTLVLHVFGTTLLEFLEGSTLPFFRFLTEFLDLRFFLLLFLQTALFTAMFMALPNRKNSFSDSIPGALLASIGWLVFSALFSIYVEHFSSYATIYGSVYAIALSMLWLYFCILIVFYGGALNSFLKDKEDA